MRAPAVGWAVPPGDVERRRQLTEELTLTTHGSAEALVSAHIVAAMASWALEGVSGETLAGVALEELDAHSLPADACELIRAAAAGTWKPPAAGIPMEAVDTVAAVIAVLRDADAFTPAILESVGFGGDTDSVAALVGGLLACREAGARLRWASQVRLPEADTLDALAAALASRRYEAYA
jgi:ADP-ribosylglycohydrolase